MKNIEWFINKWRGCVVIDNTVITVKAPFPERWKLVFESDVEKLPYEFVIKYEGDVV